MEKKNFTDDVFLCLINSEKLSFLSWKGSNEMIRTFRFYSFLEHMRYPPGIFPVIHGWERKRDNIFVSQYNFPYQSSRV